MKKLSLCALAVMSINSYASVEHLNAKEWTTGQGATGSMEILEEYITEPTKGEKKNLSYNLTAATKAYYGKIHQTLALQGQHSLTLSNTTNQRGSYTITFYLCVLNINCYNNTYTISLNSGASYQIRTNSLLNFMSVNPGNFSIQAGSRSAGYENGFAYDTKPLNIEL
jgi:hypothetical protein